MSIKMSMSDRVERLERLNKIKYYSILAILVILLVTNIVILHVMFITNTNADVVNTNFDNICYIISSCF